MSTSQIEWIYSWCCLLTQAHNRCGKLVYVLRLIRAEDIKDLCHQNSTVNYWRDAIGDFPPDARSLWSTHWYGAVYQSTLIITFRIEKADLNEYFRSTLLRLQTNTPKFSSLCHFEIALELADEMGTTQIRALKPGSQDAVSWIADPRISNTGVSIAAVVEKPIVSYQSSCYSVPHFFFLKIINP